MEELPDRRFQTIAANTPAGTVVTDYAHHPTEIAATLAAAKNTQHEKMYVAFQPHTYTRTRALLDDFASALSAADVVLLADIYAAREKDDGSVSSKDLEKKILEKGGNAIYLGDFDSIRDYAEKNLKNNDLLITMGAGNIDSVGDLLIKK